MCEGAAFGIFPPPPPLTPPLPVSPISHTLPHQPTAMSRPLHFFQDGAGLPTSFATPGPSAGGTTAVDGEASARPAVPRRDPSPVAGLAMSLPPRRVSQLGGGDVHGMCVLSFHRVQVSNVRLVFAVQG
jgi:hypothetical protein